MVRRVEGPHQTVESPGFAISLAVGGRVARVRGVAGASLSGDDAVALVGALRGWFSGDAEPFGVLADMRGVAGADAAYRRETLGFFRKERERAYVAAYHMGPVIRVIAEMFRLASGIELRAFAEEGRARSWLSAHGLEA